MDFSERLKVLKKELDDAKLNRTKYQTKLEELEKQEKSLNEEIRKLGIEPDELENSVIELKNEIEMLLSQAEKEMEKDA